MITPRRTRLVRVADLHVFRRTIDALSNADSNASARLVLVPNRAAGRLVGGSAASAARPEPPDIATRDQMYERLRARLAGPLRMLSPIERDALAQQAAEEASAAAPGLAFKLRPGLVVEMLRFYDQLRRQSQHANRFEELIVDALGDPVEDRGAERLLVQTRFLASAFRRYERRIEEIGACDEHALRDRLMKEPAPDPLRHVIVTTADWIADPDGLFVADFDLLARLPGLEAVEVICTEAVLASGFHERIHQWWPGIEEVEASELVGEQPRIRPALTTPVGAGSECWFTRRDREEELVEIAKQIRRGESRSTAIVFKRPLPYVYLAPDTLGAAGVRYQAFDALPLAAEPTTAAIDLVLDAVESDFARGPLTALLLSPHFRFVHDGEEVSLAAARALDRRLVAARFLGGCSKLEELRAGERDVPAALEAALAAATWLAPLASPAPASEQVSRLLEFVTAHFRPLDADSPFTAREQRARTTLLDLLARLAAGQAEFHDPPWTIADLGAAVRRRIEEETFLPEPAEVALPAQAGPDRPAAHLLDDRAARYGDFDDVAIVGLVEQDWPETPRRNIFYGAGLLKALGWPSERDRRSAADAQFLDLLASARSRVLLSTFTLDEEALVTRSIQLDEVPRAALSAAPLLVEPCPSNDPGPARTAWSDLRDSRSPRDARVFHGQLGAQPPRPWSVSALETYLGCPFRFFAQHVLELEEEAEDEEVMDPRRQGAFVHEVFETFFKEWQAAGYTNITADNLDVARSRFSAVVECALDRLPEAEAGLERTRLLGSPAAAGLGEAVFRMEAERPTPVVGRLLEERLDGEVAIDTSSGARVIRLRGKVDRIDLLDDGTFRLVDYKLGWPPKGTSALQLPIYALRAEQQLEGRAARAWRLGEAMYVAFKGPRRVVPLFTTASDREQALAKGQERLASTIDAIERGEFPPTPDDIFRCETCSFAAVCRKDYV